MRATTSPPTTSTTPAGLFGLFHMALMSVAWPRPFTGVVPGQTFFGGGGASSFSTEKP